MWTQIVSRELQLGALADASRPIKTTIVLLSILGLTVVFARAISHQLLPGIVFAPKVASSRTSDRTKVYLRPYAAAIETTRLLKFLS